VHSTYRRDRGPCTLGRIRRDNVGKRSFLPSDFVNHRDRVKIGEPISRLRKGSFNLFEELEKIGLAQDLFGIDFPVDLAFDNPPELVDYLVLRLRGWGPNPFAADFLKKLAETHNSPALAQGLHNSWRREQISAIIQEIFNTGDRSAGGDDGAVIPVRKPRSPKSGGRAAAQSLDADNPSARR
jgi:hypothetical protein